MSHNKRGARNRIFAVAGKLLTRSMHEPPEQIKDGDGPALLRSRMGDGPALLRSRMGDGLPFARSKECLMTNSTTRALRCSTNPTELHVEASLATALPNGSSGRSRVWRFRMHHRCVPYAHGHNRSLLDVPEIPKHASIEFSRVKPALCAVAARGRVCVHTCVHEHVAQRLNYSRRFGDIAKKETMMHKPPAAISRLVYPTMCIGMCRTHVAHVSLTIKKHSSRRFS